jgi:exosortase
LVAASCALIALAIAYADVAAGLVRQWSADDNYSHGFVVVPLALWFAWERRHALAGAPFGPSLIGLGVIAVGLAMLAVGTLGAELFLSRLSLLFVLSGLVLFVAGPSHLRVLAFPLAFLLLMIPIPAILFNRIAFPLQLLASQVGAATLDFAGVPVLREGNVLVLASTKLEVAEACSGIRSLVTLLTLAIVLGQFSLRRRWSRLALMIASLPVAIAANAARVAGTGFAAHFWSPEAAEGFFHAFSGWAMFGVAFGVLLAVQRALTLAEDRVQHEGSTRGFSPTVQPKGSEI